MLFGRSYHFFEKHPFVSFVRFLIGLSVFIVTFLCVSGFVRIFAHSAGSVTSMNERPSPCRWQQNPAFWKQAQSSASNPVTGIFFHIGFPFPHDLLFECLISVFNFHVNAFNSCIFSLMMRVLGCYLVNAKITSRCKCTSD